MGKRKKGEQRTGTCVYCGAEGPVTKEHVFARRLFEVKDDEMLTVPACQPCNTKKELGDRDLDLYVTMHIGGSQHPDAMAHAERLLEKTNNRTKRWLRRSLEGATEIDLVTWDGIVLDGGIEFPFDTSRIIWSLEQTIRGLHFHETKIILPPTCSVFVEEIPWSNAPEFAHTRSQQVPFRPQGKGHAVAWWQSFELEDMPVETQSWLICFNNWVLFHGVTGELANRVRDRRQQAITSRAESRAFEELIFRGQRRKVRVPQRPDGRYLPPPRD